VVRFVFMVVLGWAVLGTAPGGAPAAEPRYSEWSNPGAAAAKKDQGQMRQLLDRLGGLIDEAEGARAADPKFLKDLRGLAREFSNPWPHPVLSDDFSDGDFTANPAWSVSGGAYVVQKGWGLRGTVEPGAPQPAPEKERRTSGRDAAAALFGSVLNQALGGRRGGGGSEATAAAPAESAVAAIHTAAKMTNAFSIEVEFSSWQNKGRLEWGPYAGPGREQGYSLAYTPGGGLELLSFGQGRARVVEIAPGPFVLEDRRKHRILWTRDGDGAMEVHLDGKKVLATSDQGRPGPFDGLRIVNRGGDYIFARVTVLDGG